MAVGLGYGDNFLAVLISNSAMEMARFLRESYPDQRETRASAYLGDLLVTCYSVYSRNRKLGLLIGHGCTVRDALDEMTRLPKAISPPTASVTSTPATRCRCPLPIWSMKSFTKEFLFGKPCRSLRQN